MVSLLDPLQAEEHHEPGPLRPFEPGPPLPARTPLPPPAPLSEGERGKGSRLERVPALWAVWAWEYDEPGAPHEPGPLASPDDGVLQKGPPFHGSQS